MAEVSGLGYGESLSAFVALEVILSSVKVSDFLMHRLGRVGVEVLMIRSIIEDSYNFFAWALCMLYGFALGLMVVLRHSFPEEQQDSRIPPFTEAPDAPQNVTLPEDSDLVEDSFGTFLRSVATRFFAMLGAFESELFHSLEDRSSFAAVLFSLYLICFAILFLNLLISIMTDTFDRVKSAEEAEVLMGKARLIDAWEASLTESQRREIDEKLPKYILAVVDPDNIDDEQPPHEWTGKLDALDRRLRLHIRESENTLKNELQTVRDNLEAQEERLAEHTRRLEEQISALNEDMTSRMDRLLHHLTGEAAHSPSSQSDLSSHEAN